jgi:hypothetical protein
MRYIIALVEQKRGDVSSQVVSIMVSNVHVMLVHCQCHVMMEHDQRQGVITRWLDAFLHVQRAAFLERFKLTEQQPARTVLKPTSSQNLPPERYNEQLAKYEQETKAIMAHRSTVLRAKADSLQPLPIFEAYRASSAMAVFDSVEWWELLRAHLNISTGLTLSLFAFTDVRVSTLSGTLLDMALTAVMLQLEGLTVYTTFIA